MNAQERGRMVLKSLSTAQAREQWARDPVQYLVANGFVKELPAEVKANLGRYLGWIALPPLEEHARLVGGGWWECNGCKIGIGATVFAIAAVVVAACIAAAAASGGAAAPEEVAAAPELAEGAAGAAAVAVAAETGLTVTRVAQIFATAFVSYGVAGFAEAAIEALCQATGACEG